MKQDHPFRVAGVGTAIGAVMIGSFWLACQPGKLPCDKAEYKDVCALPDSTGLEGGGGGGGGGGSGGSGTDAMAPVGVLSDNTPINCAEFPTLGKMDDFFSMRCGVNSTCHAPPTAWSDLKSPKVWDRILKAPDPVFSCKGAKLIDKANWSNSVLMAKTKAPVACPPGGTNPGLQMPPSALPPMMPLLTAAETACLESFLKVATGGSK